MAGEALKCPSCSAPLESSRQAGVEVCPYCRTRVRITRSQSGVLSAELVEIKLGTDLLLRENEIRKLEERLAAFQAERARLWERRNVRVKEKEGNQGAMSGCALLLGLGGLIAGVISLGGRTNLWLPAAAGIIASVVVFVMLFRSQSQVHALAQGKNDPEQQRVDREITSLEDQLTRLRSEVSAYRQELSAAKRPA